MWHEFTISPLAWTPIVVTAVIIGMIVWQLRRPDRNLGPAITLIIVSGVLVVVFVGLYSATLDVMNIFSGFVTPDGTVSQHNLGAEGLWYSLRTASTTFTAAASLSAFGGVAVFFLRRIRPLRSTSVTTD